MATIIFAGGGTAGHIEPALAVAREWKSAHAKDDIVFLGTTHGLENAIVPAAGFTLAHIPRVSISRKPSLSWLQIPFDLFRSVAAAGSIIKKADLLIGFGGYVSAPAYIAAGLRRIPIVIHEANAKPGWANRLGAVFTKNLAVAYGVSAGAFSNALLTGLPLRSDVATALIVAEKNWSQARHDAKVRLGFNNSKPLVFVMGGSQGSVAINSIIATALPEMMSHDISLLHSVGRRNVLPQSSDSYRPVAYVDAMADAYLASDLIIARSGAVTCSEFRALGRYALFVPLPIGNGEQFYNASQLVQDGRATVIAQKDFTAEFLVSQIQNILLDAEKSQLEGSTLDALAAQKIAALGEFAMGGK